MKSLRLPKDPRRLLRHRHTVSQLVQHLNVQLKGSRSAHSHSHLYEAVDQILLCMRKAGAGADEGRPSGCQEETAGGLSSSQPRQEPSEGDNKKQTPTFRFPQGNWSTREQYYAQVPFQGNPYAGKGGPSAPFIDPLAMPPVSYF